MICECCKEREAEQYYNVEEMFVCNYCLDDFLREVEEEDVNPVGRPAIGETKKVSITLTSEEWQLLEEFQNKFNTINSRSQLLRLIIREFLEKIQS